MGTDKVIRFRYWSTLTKVKQLCVELLTLSPHFTQEERTSIDKEIEKCLQVVRGERS